MNEFNTIYVSTDWRIFIDSSKRSLKVVLLHNENVFASIPVGHSVHLKERYKNLELILDKIKYGDHKWIICGDHKIISMLLGQQGSYTKFPCFLCEWDSRDTENYWKQKDWPRRALLKPGAKNVPRKPLVDSEKVLLPPLHIELGLMKQFVKALLKEGKCFKYICNKFPALSDAKVKEDISTGPDMRKLLKDENFLEEMNIKEKNAWEVFKDVVTKLLDNKKDPNFKSIVENMLQKFQKLGCLMSLKVHFLHLHLDYFPESLGAASEEMMIADYCWVLHRDEPIEKYKRRSAVQSMKGQKKLRHAD